MYPKPWPSFIKMVETCLTFRRTITALTLTPTPQKFDVVRRFCGLYQYFVLDDTLTPTAWEVSPNKAFSADLFRWIWRRSCRYYQVQQFAL